MRTASRIEDLGVELSNWVCLKIGYIPNEIAIFHRDNDQQDHWVFRGTQHFQTHPTDVNLPVVQVANQSTQVNTMTVMAQILQPWWITP